MYMYVCIYTYIHIHIYIYIYIYIYIICPGYFIAFIFLKNFFASHLSKFLIHKSQHNRHLLIFFRKLMFLKYSCQKPVKKNDGRLVFLEELQAAINF